MSARHSDASICESRVGIGACIASIAIGPGIMLACLIVGRLFGADGDLGILLVGVCFFAHCVALFVCVLALIYARRGWWLLAVLLALYESWFLSGFMGA